MARFKVGDRVSRNWDIYIPNSPLMYGRIIEIYSDMESKYGPYPELYSVEWDHGKIDRGYLQHGLFPNM